MKNRILSKSERKEQREALKTALKAEKSQGSALRALKRLNKDYEMFNLSDFQQTLLDKQDAYFDCVQAVYTKTQQRKIEQLNRLKNDKEPLLNYSYSVVYSVGDKEYTIKTFKDEETAESESKALPLKNVKVVQNESEQTTTFTPNEMLQRLHVLEKKFFDTWENAKDLTVPMLKTAIGMEITEKEKKEVKKHKTKIENKAA